MLFMPEVMALFPLGLAAAKTYAPSGDLEGSKPLARQILKWLWLPGLTFNAFYALANNTIVFHTMLALGMRGAFVPPADARLYFCRLAHS
jgi:hypothetical protein